MNGTLIKLRLLFNLLDPCIKDPCRNGGTCANNQSAPNGFTCSCASDFQGDVCEETIGKSHDFLCNNHRLSIYLIDSKNL